MARAVLPGGKVLAVDVQEEMLAGLRERVGEAGLENVEAVLAGVADPGLSYNFV